MSDRHAHKQAAKRLDSALTEQGLHPLGKRRALEAISALYGVDWNTLSARPEMPLLTPEKQNERLNEVLKRYDLSTSKDDRDKLIRATLGAAAPSLIHAAYSLDSLTPPFPDSLKEQLGFALLTDRSFSFADYENGLLTEENMQGSDDPEEDDYDEEAEFTRDDWAALKGLTENLDDWLDSIAGAGPELERLAQRGRVSVNELLETVFAPAKGGHLPDLTLIRMYGIRKGEHVSLHPEQWISHIWAIGRNFEAAEQQGLWHVAQNYGLIQTVTEEIDVKEVEKTLLANILMSQETTVPSMHEIIEKSQLTDKNK